MSRRKFHEFSRAKLAAKSGRNNDGNSHGMSNGNLKRLCCFARIDLSDGRTARPKLTNDKYRDLAACERFLRFSNQQES
jgi:hypothetical protein